MIKAADLSRKPEPVHHDLLAESSDQHRTVTSGAVSFQGVTSHPGRSVESGGGYMARQPQCRRVGRHRSPEPVASGRGDPGPGPRLTSRTSSALLRAGWPVGNQKRIFHPNTGIIIHVLISPVNV